MLTKFHYIDVRMQKKTKICFKIWHFDELKVDWTVVLVIVFIRSEIRKCYHNDIKYHMTLKTIFGIVRNRDTHIYMQGMIFIILALVLNTSQN